MEDGSPYPVDFMNTTPDADIHAVSRERFYWIVEKIANLAVSKALSQDKSQMNCTAFLGSEKKVNQRKAAAK